jgi:hypothetical protein
VAWQSGGGVKTGGENGSAAREISAAASA